MVKFNQFIILRNHQKCKDFFHFYGKTRRSAGLCRVRMGILPGDALPDGSQIGKFLLNQFYPACGIRGNGGIQIFKQLH